MNYKSFIFTILLTISAVFIANHTFGAVGCTLNNPDRDTKKYFPSSTNYISYFKNISSLGGSSLKAEIENKLGDKLDSRTEYEVDYAYYKILKGKKHIGWMFGTNQRGKYGNLQVILVTDTDGVVKDIYFQMITAPYGDKLRDSSFTKQFTGLTLKDFYLYDGQSKNYDGEDRVAWITNPAYETKTDFFNVLRAVKKLLILHDVFWKNKTSDQYFGG